MKYLSRLLAIAGVACGLTACNDVAEIVNPNGPQPGDMPVNVTFSLANRAKPTRSKVSGTETVVTTMQLVCFDANKKYLGIRDAQVTSEGGTGAPMHFWDTGVIKGTVPQNTSCIHFIANRNLNVPLLESIVGDDESDVMNTMELSTAYDDTNHQKICYWGYHAESSAEAMNSWLQPDEGSNHIVYMIRDRARVILKYDPTGASVPVTKIEWLIHNGRERGYLAPAKTNWTNTGYYGYSTVEGQEAEYVSTASMHEYTTCNRYSLWRSTEDHDSTKFDVAYNGANTLTPQFLFEDNNEQIDDVKVILRVTYTVDGAPKTVYHVLRLNTDKNPDGTGGDLYDIVRNNTYYITCKLLNPDVAFYETLKEAIDGEEFVNADTEVDRSIPDINNATYTLQIKLPNEGTSTVLNTEGEHTMDFVFRYANDINTSGSTDPNDFEVKWEKSQTFCSTSLPVTYDSTTKQFTITATVLDGQLTDHLQDEWIVVKHKASGLTRYIHVYVIDQFRYQLDPTLTKVGDDYLLSFQLPPMEHTQFLPDGTGDPNELIYPEGLYPIDVKFTTNTLNAYGIVQNQVRYGYFGVSIEPTSQLTNVANFENEYNSPVSSTSTSDMIHWYYQQANNYWDFWYTYQLKTCPENAMVNIYFKDVRDHIQYAQSAGGVQDVGLFLYVEYFGKNYSVPVTQ